MHLASMITDPPVPGVDGAWIRSEITDKGFCFIYIPESPLPPHRVLLKSDPKINGHYYQRTGDSFNIALHTQLEDMFGRRPKPKLELSMQPTFHGGRCTYLLNRNSKHR